VDTPSYPVNIPSTAKTGDKAHDNTVLYLNNGAALGPIVSQNAELLVRAGQLTSTKSVDKLTAVRGDILTYTVTVSNTSIVAATGVTATDTVPAGLTVGVVSDSGVVAVGADGTSVVSWVVPTLAPGAAVSYTVTASVNGTPNTGPQASFANAFTVSTPPTFDPPVSGDPCVSAALVGQSCAVTTIPWVVTPHDTAVITALGQIIQTTGTPFDPRSVVQVSAPAHGSISIDPSSGAVRYTPMNTFTGVDSYVVKVCDGTSPSPVCTNATVPVTVGANTVRAVADVVSTPVNTAVGVWVLGNDVSGAPVTTPLDSASVVVTVAAVHGSTVVDSTAGVVTYTPVTGFSGTDTFTYKMCDTSAGPPVCASAVDTITVTDKIIDKKPVVVTPHDTAVTTLLTDIAVSNGSYPLDPRTVTQTSAPLHGVISIDPGSGDVSYTPTDRFTGADSYVVHVCNSNPMLTCADISVPVTVQANMVQANPDFGLTPPVTPVTTDVLANDGTHSAKTPLDPASVFIPGEGVAGTVAQGTAQGPIHGVSVVDVVTGKVTYTPDVDFSGVDTYIYQVCDTSAGPPVCSNAVVTITVPNAFTADPIGPTSPGGPHAPTLTAAPIITPHDTPVTTPLSKILTVTGARLNPVKIIEVLAPSYGIISVDLVTGAVTYTPNNKYTGPDSYTINVCDTSTPISVCQNVTVPVTVGANTVQAHQDFGATAPVTPIIIDVLANDVTGSVRTPLDPASVRLVVPVRDVSGRVGQRTQGGAAHGVTTVDPVTGKVTYIPDAGFSGVDTYVYGMCDTSNGPPLCADALVTITVSNVFTGDPAGPTSPGGPTAVTLTSTAVSTPHDTPVLTALNKIVTTSGAPLNPTTVTSVTLPVHGSIVVDPVTGAIAYTPVDKFTGLDGFVINVCDTQTPRSVCQNVKVPVTVGANTVGPKNDSGYTKVNVPVSMLVLSNDLTGSSKTPLNPASVTVAAAGAVGGPGHGITTVNKADGAVLYTPGDGSSGVDHFRYTVCDTSVPMPVCGTAVVTVTVTDSTLIIPVYPGGSGGSGGPGNPGDPVVPPVSTPHDTPVSTVLSKIAFTNGDPLDPTKVTPVTGPIHGAIKVDPITGAVTYTPTDTYTGPDSYTVNVCTKSTPAICKTVPVPVVVGPNTIKVVGGNVTTDENTAVTISVLGNDSSSSSLTPINMASVTIPAKGAVGGPSHGTVSIDPVTGLIVYTPDHGYLGADSFVYSVCDTSTPTRVCGSATVTITVISAGPGSLPNTGFDTLGFGGVAGSLLLLGLFFLLVGRRRWRKDEDVVQS